MSKLKTFFIISIIMTLFLSGCSEEKSAKEGTSGNEESYNFKMTFVTQNTHIWNSFAEKFAEELSDKSDGRMKMEIYPAAQLGPEPDMVQQLENGSIDFAVLTVPYLSSRFPSLDAWNMPFLFEDIETTMAAQDSESAQEMFGLLDGQGLKGIGYMFAGNHHLLMKNDAIKNVEDVKGLKIRFTGGPSVLDYWKGLGASPIAMGLPEVYSALQTGVIDGVSVDTNALLSEKFYEIADNFVLTSHMAFGGMIVGSKMNFEKMSEKDQKIIDEAAKVAAEWGRNELIRIDTENLTELEKHITVVELESRDRLYRRSQKGV